ncbi:MAG: VIT and vWA domain-containing protein [Pyrinomonadaceae bacterium]
MPTKRITIRLAAVLLMIISLAAGSAHAQGIIIPRPCGRCPRPIPLPRPIQLPRALPVKYIKLDTKIREQVATTHVEQIFRNDTDAMLEGTYFFPIPETASITEFAIWDGERKLVGEVRSREEARRIYDDIMRRQRDPGLLEYAGKDLFQASIFPINPHSDKKLELTYTQILRAENNTVAYRYPLGTGGRQLAAIGTVAGRIEIEGRDALRNLYSPTHKIDTARNGANQARVSFESAAGRDPQDFQLFYTLSRDDFASTLLTHREPGKDGYFLLMISPKDDLAEREYAAKDIVFVLDTSGSMADEGKMEKARAALLFGVKNLRAADRFNVVSFSGEEHLMAANLIAANDEGRARGLKFIQALQPTGGTNINDAVLAALKQFDGQSRPKMIVFLTDGLPTVGETKIASIIGNVRDANARTSTVARNVLAGDARGIGEVRGTVRLFTFGVGYDVNTQLLDKLAAENGGAADYIEPKEDLEIKVSGFFVKVTHPVLTDLQIDMGGVETDSVYPRSLPDIFRGAQLTLIGRYRNANDLRNISLRLTGDGGGGNGNHTRTFTYTGERFPLIEDGNDFLPRLWATRRVGWLMEQIRANGEVREVRDEIVDLGTRYGIVTPYTSYLALESNNSAQANDDMILNSPLPMNGRRAMKRDRAPSMPSSSASAGNGNFSATTGAEAVQMSKGVRAQQETITVTGDSSAASATKRDVRGKTFYLREGAWTDAEFKAEARLPETMLSFGSDDYFALLKREPRLAEFFALGERVIVVFNARVYRIEKASP